MKNILIALLVLTAVMIGGRVFADENAGGPASGTPAEVAAPEQGQTETGGPAPEAGATDSEQQEEEVSAPEEAPVVHYEMKPEGSAWLGYRFFDLDDSRKAAEYEYPYGSIVGGFKMLYVPLPSRWEADLDWVNPQSWTADASFAWRDVIKLDYLGWALWRNYNHFGIIGGSHATAVDIPIVAQHDRDPKGNYFTDDRDNRLYMRLKWPDRPYHIFIDLRQFEKEGTVQARFYEVPVKKSRSRQIDWVTTKLNVGVNGHFGPVEAEYSHTAKTFDPYGDVKLVDHFGAPINKTLIHDVVPQYDDNLDTVKIHTDYTGRISADGTFINGERRNEHSQAELDYRRAYGDLNFIPLPGLTMAVRYRFNRTNETVPQAVFTSARGTAHGMATDPIDIRSNKAEVAIRYAPVNLIAFKAEYSFENLKRYNASLWSDLNLVPFQTIPQEQNIHKVTAGVTSKPARWVDFKGSVEYTYTDEPAYPIKPKNSVKGRVDANLMPLPQLTSNIHYRFATEDNHRSELPGNFDNNMHSKYDNPGIQAVWTPAPPLTFSAAYDYFRYSLKRNIMMAAPATSTVVSPNPRFPVERAPYKDQAHVYSISGAYSFAMPLTLDAEFYQSFGSGKFRIIETTGAFTTEGVGELADMGVRETGGRVTARYTLPRDWGVSLTYSINDYADFKNKPQDGPQNGTAQTVMMLATKKW